MYPKVLITDLDSSQRYKPGGRMVGKLVPRGLIKANNLNTKGTSLLYQL